MNLIMDQLGPVMQLWDGADEGLGSLSFFFFNITYIKFKPVSFFVARHKNRNVL